MLSCLTLQKPHVHIIAPTQATDVKKNGETSQSSQTTSHFQVHLSDRGHLWFVLWRLNPILSMLQSLLIQKGINMQTCTLNQKANSISQLLIPLSRCLVIYQ